MTAERDDRRIGRIADELEYRMRTAAALARGGYSIQAEVDRGKARIRALLTTALADDDQGEASSSSTGSEHG